MNKKLNPQTLAIKNTLDHDIKANPVSNTIIMSTNFVRNDDGTFEGNFGYSRASNPNRAILEQSIAELEYGTDAMAFGSGMAAIHAIFQCFKPGDHFIIPDDVYFNVTLLTREILEDWGLKFSKVDCSNPDNILKAIRPETKLIWLETPSNPLLKITDIESICNLVKEKNILTAVDNTWPSPVLMNPILLGADIVIHSTTKYFGGHSDVIGGCVVLKEKNTFSEKLRNLQILGGAVPSPFDCWLITRGIQTLHLRVKAQTKGAQALAEHLSNHPKIEKVFYPGLKDHPGHQIASRQMNEGFGAMLSVLVRGGEKVARQIANELDLFTQATSLGGIESLVEHRRSVEGPESMAPANLLRLSIGLEHPDDLMNDWETALKKIN